MHINISAQDQIKLRQALAAAGKSAVRFVLDSFN